MNDRSLVKEFWGCGDNQIVEFALLRARLNRNEKNTLRLMLDECMTQEAVAEELNVSTRCVQDWWKSGCDKLLEIPWVKAYAADLRQNK